MTGPSSPTTEATRWTTKLFNGSGSVFEAGLQSASRVYCNLPRVPPVFPSMVSRIFKAQMDRVASQSRSLVTHRSCPRVIRALIALTYLLIKITQAWSISLHLLSSAYFFSCRLDLSTLLTSNFQGNCWVWSRVNYTLLNSGSVYVFDDAFHLF